MCCLSLCPYLLMSNSLLHLATHRNKKLDQRTLDQRTLDERTFRFDRCGKGKTLEIKSSLKTATRSDCNAFRLQWIARYRPVTSWMLQPCEVTVCGYEGILWVFGYFVAIPRAGRNYVGDTWLLGRCGAQNMCHLTHVSSQQSSVEWQTTSSGTHIH